MARGAHSVPTCAPLVAACVAACVAAAAAAVPEGRAPACVSKPGRAPFPRHGEPPAPTSEPLGPCSAYRGSTCCARPHGEAARLSSLLLSDAPEACREAWTKLECSVCAPEGGVVAGAPVCEHYCDAALAACGGEYFSAAGQAGVLAPCRPTDHICTRASEWVSTGAELCELAGFTVVPALEGGWCFEGKQPRPAAAAGRPSDWEPPRRRAEKGMLGTVLGYLVDYWWVVAVVAGAGGYMYMGQRKREMRLGERREAARRAAEKRYEEMASMSQAELDRMVKHTRADAKRNYR